MSDKPAPREDAAGEPSEAVGTLRFAVRCFLSAVEMGDFTPQGVWQVNSHAKRMREALAADNARPVADAVSREAAIEAAEAFLHSVDDTDKSPLATTARYSNGTVRRIVAALRSLPAAK